MYRRAFKEYAPLITQASSVTEPEHMPVARQTQMAALRMLNWQQMTSMQNFRNPCNFAVLKVLESLKPVRVKRRLEKLDLQDKIISVSMCTASPPDQGKTEGPRVQHQRRPAAAFEKPVAAQQAVYRSTSHLRLDLPCSARYLKTCAAQPRLHPF